MVHLRTWKRNSDVFGLACNMSSMDRDSSALLFHSNHVIPDLYSWPAISYAATDISTTVFLYVYLEIWFPLRYPSFCTATGTRRAKSSPSWRYHVRYGRGHWRKHTKYDEQYGNEGRTGEGAYFLSNTHIPPLRILFSIIIHNKLTLHR